MPQPEIVFAPSPDVTVLLNALLDKLERRMARSFPPGEEEPMRRAVKVLLEEIHLPGYTSQMDPSPRQVANEQLQALERLGRLRLTWQAGEEAHLLAAVALLPGQAALLYPLVGRVPLAALRSRLEAQLLGDRFRFSAGDWRYRAIQHVLARLKVNQSPGPFNLADPDFNQDLLIGLAALSQLEEETPFRVFSVRTFNDSKRFEALRKAMVRLARLGQPEWRRLPEDELLRELHLVANPGYLLLSGAWTLVDADGGALDLAGFCPSVGVPAVQAMHVQDVGVNAAGVLCIENATTFHTAAGHPSLQHMALLCLAGNPSPACRRLLSCLDAGLPEDVPLYVWADLDYGGFNILAQLRRQVGPRCRPFRMDIETLEAYARFARPLSQEDRRNLERLSRRPELGDVRPVMQHMLRRGIKLEQEAVAF
ncbi:MAG: DUF2220 family protein [Anaerolineaceae bacterium]|nr:DUF2220 family protein [Anaerolineaceae bacterium]